MTKKITFLVSQYGPPVDDDDQEIEVDEDTDEEVMANEAAEAYAEEDWHSEAWRGEEKDVWVRRNGGSHIHQFKVTVVFDVHFTSRIKVPCVACQAPEHMDKIHHGIKCIRCQGTGMA